tara:strand:- start:83 stop:706 length:624 start_codon:yes stop_codon:yes gene_type:complete
MTLQSSGTISMDNMRTEFGISGAISMSDLYRGGSEVPSTANLGGSVTTDAISFTSHGGNASGNVTSTKALGTTVASSDTFSSFTYAGSFTAKKSGGFSVPFTRVFFSNSSGTLVGSILSQSAATHNESTPTAYSTSVSGTTVSSNHVGATHITAQAADTGGQFREEDTQISASVNAFTFTIAQTRDANTSVPTSGTISFSDLYGAAT